MHTKVSPVGRVNSPAYPVFAYFVYTSLFCLRLIPISGSEANSVVLRPGNEANLVCLSSEMGFSRCVIFWWLEATLKLRSLLTLQASFYYIPTLLSLDNRSLEMSPETTPLPNPVPLPLFLETQNRMKQTGE